MLSALFLATVIGISDGDTLTVLNKERQQVSRGMAWVYRKYAKDHNLFIYEHEAKRQKRGLWVDKAPTPPWQWRKSARYAALRLLAYV
jgi:micrococcal nuclease